MTNWNEIWKESIFSARLTEDNYYDNEERAKSYDSSQSIWMDGERRALDLQIDPTWTVLDIGCGPGILTVPLASRVRKVTAIEPSGPMIRCLERHLMEERLSNVSIIKSRWEDISADHLEAHDLVIASFSLNIVDIQAALLKMNFLAKRKVILYWFAGIANWEMISTDLLPTVFGQNAPLYPKCNVLYNLLYDLELYPDVQILQGTSFPKEYSDCNEALLYLKATLNVGDNSQDHLLRKYIEENWRRDDGSLFMEDKTIYVKLSWNPRNPG